MMQITPLWAFAVVATFASTDAYALSNRTFVSGNGSDSNPCSIASPCRSFAGALAQTNPGGEIAVLDTAGYGAVSITKAISIVNEEGVEAGITATSGDGITINAGASDVVNLRGLTLVGVPGSNNGITFNSGGVLNIQNCVVRGFSSISPNGNGLNLVPTGNADINVSNTIVSDNFFAAILLQPIGTSITVTASFEQVQAIHNGGAGFFVGGSNMTGAVRAIAADSLASGNGSGFVSNSLINKAATTFTVTNSKAANNSTGLLAGGSAIFLNGSTVSGNSTGFSASGGVINSYGNNAITDTTNSGSLTSVALR
jgi:hypothetical protein